MVVVVERENYKGLRFHVNNISYFEKKTPPSFKRHPPISAVP